MAESYSVKAILSAADKGFSSTLKSAMGSVNSLGNTVKSGIGFGILTGIGQQAFSAITNSVSGLISEVDSSNASWKTFRKNLEIVGRSDKYIGKAENSLKRFAEQTVYSSSDMATTFAQLEAVGIKSADKLVVGFGGIASAAENPQQAMKTLSQQATQMAAKPTVAWQDFKLMLEQTPAGIAAVAKEMGMTTSELVSSVQDGTIATQDFFDAISKVGTSKEFSELATQAKTVGQAMDGLKETVGNKLTPAFDILSQAGISAVNGIADKLGEINGEALASKASAGLKKAGQYWEAFKESFSGVGTEVMEAFDALRTSFSGMTGEFGKVDTLETFKDVMSGAADGIKTFANFIEEHSDTIAKATPYVVKFALAFKGLQIVKSVVPGMSMFTSAISGLAGKGISGLAGKLFGVAGGQDAVGKSSGSSSKKMLASAKAFMMLGVGVLTISAGFYLLAQSAVSVANAGPLAVGVLVGLVGTVTALSIGMTKMLSTMSGGTKKLAVMSTAMLALGASILLISTGFWVLSDAAVKLAEAGPLAVGAMAGLVIGLGALLLVAKSVAPALTTGAIGFVAFGAAIVLAGVGMVLLTNAAINLASAGPLAIGVMVGMIAAVAGFAAVFALLAPALTAGAVGFIAFGAAILLVGTGALLAGAALSIVASVLPTVCQYGLQGAVAIAQLGAGMVAFAAGATMAGAVAVILGAGLLVMSAGLLTAGAGALVAATGILALSAACALLGASLTLTASSLTMVAGILPAAASGALVLMAAFTTLLAISMALSVALIATNVPLVLIGVSSLAAGAGIMALGAGCVVAVAGLTAMGFAMKLVNSSMKSISANAQITQNSFASMVSSMNVVRTGLIAVSAVAKSSMNKIKSAFDSTAGKVQSAAKKIGTGFSNGIKPGLKSALSSTKQTTNQISNNLKQTATKARSTGTSLGTGFSKGIKPGLKSASSSTKQTMNQISNNLKRAATKARSTGTSFGTGFSNSLNKTLKKSTAYASSATSQVNSRLRSGRSGAYSAGAYVSAGFAAGLRSMLGSIRSAAQQIVNAANRAIQAKAKIHSPSKVTLKYGRYYGKGFVNGVLDMVKDARKASEELINIPQVATPNLALAYGGELSEEFDYSRKFEYNITVVSELDGKEVGKGTARYVEDEMNKKAFRNSRKKGKV